MQVAFAQEGVCPSPQFDLGTLLGVKEDPVTNFDLPGVRPGGDHLAPRETTTDTGGRRDENPSARAPFALISVEGDEEAVVQHTAGETLGMRLLLAFCPVAPFPPPPNTQVGGRTSVGEPTRAPIATTPTCLTQGTS